MPRSAEYKHAHGIRLGCMLLLASLLQAASLAETNHWAFRTPVRPIPPQPRAIEAARTSIDLFVLAGLEGKGLAPSPEADRNTLLRRVYLDLVGLPPTSEQLRDFLEDKSPTAYENVVDQLLASPHFGERWGRHWLDLARYADSDGYEKDSIRPNAYLFRDWVIQAINADLPYDQFSIEQLAGDLLPDASVEQKIATGFHRNTLKNLEGGVDQEEFRCKAVVDRVGTTAAVWLGLTLACAECHNHKYDPVSQREFYQFYAFFNQASDYDLPLPTPEEETRYSQAHSKWLSENFELEKQNAIARDAIFLSLDFRLWPNQSTLDYLNVPSSLPVSLRPEENRLGALVQATKTLAAHQKKKPILTKRLAQTFRQNTPPRGSFLHIRGDFLRKGERVEPGTLAVLHPFHPRASSPDRLDLARWLFDPANPLTSRVAVNQIWSHLFGRGLVSSSADFGTRGEAPSHPELLDWLATEFPRLGWNRKALIRLIVTSATYRQSSRERPELRQVDPGNVLLGRQNRIRLPAEVLRDTALSVSGLLTRQIGGPGIRPQLPADIAALGYANSIKWQESAGADKYRRGLYIVFQRTVPYPMLMSFDAPDSNTSCTRRETSNTPIQALTLLNDPVFFECAQHLGHSLSQLGGRMEPLLEELFVRCLTRYPNDEELNRLSETFHKHRSFLVENPEAAAKLAGPRHTDAINTAVAVALSRIVMNLDEFITRE